ncbi:MAG: dipicolinate synthase subunit B [Oscillospiraceae bacterium]|jgi:dipicolinate synthase subunit B|nr:dipicolinate synthase subunit B [Oscillospiraceae bacterium]
MARIAFCLTGSYCTFAAAFAAMEKLAQRHDVQPIFSANAWTTDTRFGAATDWIRSARESTEHEPWHTLTQVEPIGPGGLFDLVIVAPCTGCTLAKLARGITDTSVTMAAKAHLRNERPVLVGISTNDALSGSAENLGHLLGTRGYYFVPMRQDDAMGKPRSLVADFAQLEAAVDSALIGEQVQPILAMNN